MTNQPNLTDSEQGASEKPQSGNKPSGKQVDKLSPEIEIWERVYDNPKNEDGSDKPNKLLGKIRITQWIYGDMSDYDCLGIGVIKDKVYLLQGREVSYTNGGTRYSLTEVTDLQPSDVPSQDKGYSEAQVQALIQREVTKAYMQGVKDELDCVRAGGHTDIFTDHTASSTEWFKLSKEVL